MTGMSVIDNAALDAQVIDLDRAREDIPRPPEFTDEALALRFAERHTNDLRYVAAWKKWLCWDGTRWQFDSTLLAFDRARENCRRAASECDRKNVAAALASAKTVAAIVSLARADRRLAATVDQWDSDPWLLNTPSGTVDLLSGQLRPHCCLDYLTKITGVGPDPEIPTPYWNTFLARVTNCDFELHCYLKRMCGYALTGSAREHALFFLYGTGGNGKSTFLNAVSAALGDYHRVAAIEAFTQSKGERHPTDIAGLRGARLVTATETEEGRRWAESRVKSLTGGDKIAARFMRQDFFEFVPQFKLLIAGNHKPGLRTVDQAMRRRFNLIPFTVAIPAEERDDRLNERLQLELPGILAFMIEGCIEWQKIGLASPEAVTAATNAYLEAEDAMAVWIEERCEHDPNSWEKTRRLYESWSSWATQAGEYVDSLKRFAEKLEVRGVSPQRKRDGRGFIGLRLREQYPE